MLPCPVFLPLVIEQICYVICFEHVCYFLLSSRWSCCRWELLPNAFKYSGGCLCFGPSFTITDALACRLSRRGSVILVRDTFKRSTYCCCFLCCDLLITNYHESWIPKLRFFFMKYYLIFVDFFQLITNEPGQSLKKHWWKKFVDLEIQDSWNYLISEVI